MEERKKKFFKRIYDNPQWVMFFIFLSLLCFIIFSHGKDSQEPEILHQGKSYKSVYLGKMGRSYLRIWKLTVDSTEYIVVGNGDADTIINHSK